jgi:hypothetical protein
VGSSGLVKRNRQPITTVTTVDNALAGTMYAVLGRSKVVRSLADLNIPFPADLPGITEETTFPLDISRVEDRALSDLQSFWGAYAARAQALLSLARARKKRLERITERKEKIIFKLHSPSNPRSTHVDALWGLVYKNSAVRSLNLKLDYITELEIVLDGLTKDFHTYLNIIQTEMTWRMSERRALRE